MSDKGQTEFPRHPGIARLESEIGRLRRWDAKYADGMTPIVAEQLLQCSATEFQGFWELICDVGEAERLQRWARAKIKELAEVKALYKEYSTTLQHLVMTVLYEPCAPVSHGWPGMKHTDAIGEGVAELLRQIAQLKTEAAEQAGGEG